VEGECREPGAPAGRAVRVRSEGAAEAAGVQGGWGEEAEQADGQAGRHGRSWAGQMGGDLRA